MATYYPLNHKVFTWPLSLLFQLNRTSFCPKPLVKQCSLPRINNQLRLVLQSFGRYLSTHFKATIQACQLAEIIATIKKLPQIYQSVVGEQGTDLSVGQKQCFAKALLKQRKALKKYSTSYYQKQLRENQSKLLPTIISLMLFVTGVQSHAEEQKFTQANLQAVLKELASAKKATVVMTGPSRSTGSQQHWGTEQFERYEGDRLTRFRGLGCAFSNNYRDSILTLVDALRKRKITLSDYYHLPYIRINVYFSTKNNQEIRLSLGRSYPTETMVDGEIQLPTHEAPYKIQIQETIYRDIYQWVSSKAHYERLDPDSEHWQLLRLNDPDLKLSERSCKILTQPDYYERSQVCDTSYLEDNKVNPPELKRWPPNPRNECLWNGNVVLHSSH